MPPRVLEKLIGYYKQPQKILDNQGLSPLKCGLKSGRIGIDQFMMWAEAYPKKLGTEHLELVNEQLGKFDNASVNCEKCVVKGWWWDMPEPHDERLRVG